MNKLSTKIKKLVILSIIIMCVLFTNIIIIQYNKMKFNVSFEPQLNERINLTNTLIEENQINNDEKSQPKENSEIATQNASIWKIKIPEINVDAEIGEGTSKEIMDKYVGHFEETKLEHGNIGLAAHNRGYPVNFFHDLKNIKIGSIITYIHGDFEMSYVVKTIKIIENTNWDYLKNTEDNRITLITCVENEPKYRRCIQGVEKVESEEY